MIKKLLLFLFLAGYSCGATLEFNLPLNGAKLTGTYVTTAHSGGSAATACGIDAGDGNWRLLFDAGSSLDEAAVFGPFRMPDEYVSGSTLKIKYSMNSATTGTVEFEACMMAVSDGDSADVGTSSFSAIAVASATVPLTVGYPDELSITLNEDSVTAGDLFYVYLSTDSDDVTNDTATGDREVIELTFIATT